MGGGPGARGRVPGVHGAAVGDGGEGQAGPPSAMVVKIPNILRVNWMGYSMTSTDARVPSNFKNRHSTPVVTTPYTVASGNCSWLNFCAATISARHCGMPAIMF